MLESAELHSAFSWDCDGCGHENFCRAIEGNIDEAALAGADHDLIDAHLESADYEMCGDQCESPALMQRIALAPPTVKCAGCGTEYRSALPAEED